MSAITCPHCHGRLRTAAFADIDLFDDSATHVARAVSCRFCAGLGTVAPEDAKRYADGQEMRRQRRARGLTAKQMADWLGVSVRDYCDRELGKLPPC